MNTYLASWPRSWTEMACPGEAWRTLATSRPVAGLTNWLPPLVVETSSSVWSFMLASAAACAALTEAGARFLAEDSVVVTTGFGWRLGPDSAAALGLGVLAAAGATMAAALLLPVPIPEVPAPDFFGKSTSRWEFLPFSSFLPVPLPLAILLDNGIQV